MQHLTAFLSGCFFAVGLAISGMIKPAKVIGFLDVTGHWDPTLAFVMGGALAVFLPAYALIKRRTRPLVTETFDLPTKRNITPQLIVGALIFGTGWGLSGICPAAGIAALPSFATPAVAVTVGMAIGIVGMRNARQLLALKTPVKEPAAADF